ncbi:MAG: hypothetical protein JWP40_1316 [Blastococcus sp.]|nr:hypothetical protein [Blastococcus sp.]
MIVLVADAIVLAVLALTVWVINGAHLPVDLAHALAAQVVAAVVTVVALVELGRFHARRAAGGGDR